VRDGGRKPWTVYGLLYPEEVVTPVPINPTVLAIFVLIFVAVAIIGLYGMYIVSTKSLKFVELLKKGGGVE
jgi:cytochrome d ubiquinol oxidase subunit I